jgi:hypothetical protein
VSNELTHTLAERWRTDWSSANAEHVARRLRTLYWLRDFTMGCGDSIPLPWQQFLMAEILRGEQRAQELGIDEVPEEATPKIPAESERVSGD